MLQIVKYSSSIDDLLKLYLQGSVERKIINILNASSALYKYDSLQELDFELRLRSAIIDASVDLFNSDFSFKTFDEAKCNSKFWNKTSEGGFLLKKDINPSAAINDIYENSSQYGTECSTAIVIIHYKALLDVIPEELFNTLFSKIYLMNWKALDPNLRELGYLNDVLDYLPGDRRYFDNPDVNTDTIEWQGENVIDLGNGAYYGHGIGIRNAEEIIKELNKYRKKDAKASAHLLDGASRPNFKRLYSIYNNFVSHHRFVQKSFKGLFIRYPLNIPLYLNSQI